MKNVKMLAIVTLTAIAAQFATANLSTNPTKENIAIQMNTEDFLEIETATLPKAVQETIASTYEGAEISKAFVNKEGIYKLELVNGDTQSVVYMNSKGEAVEL